VEPTHELDHETWAEYFDDASRELLNAPVSIEIVGSTTSMREAERLALQALNYDRRNDVFEVSAARGGPRLPAVLRHFVDHPERVAANTSTLLAPITIAVDSQDGMRTLIRIEREPDFTG
jgi:Family of unknown function (DUF5335)